MRTAPRIGALGAAATLSLVLAACGGDIGSMADHSAMTSSTTSSSTSSPAGSNVVTAEHNAQDTAFAQMMVVHHQGAIEMARLAATRASDQQVEDLAATIEAAQQPEVEQMTAWLTSWGEPLTADPSMGGMDRSGTDPSMGASAVEGSPMAGMMSEEQTGQLAGATGTDFDRMFLQMMVEHHQGAVSMAQTEQQQGQNPQALELADSVVVGQNAEIEQMTRMLSATG